MHSGRSEGYFRAISSIKREAYELWGPCLYPYYLGKVIQNELYRRGHPYFIIIFLYSLPWCEWKLILVMWICHEIMFFESNPLKASLCIRYTAALCFNQHSITLAHTSMTYFNNQIYIINWCNQSSKVQYTSDTYRYLQRYVDYPTNSYPITSISVGGSNRMNENCYNSRKTVC